MAKPHSTIASRMAGINESWLGATREAVLEPELEIIDPHHHLWDFDTHRYLLDELLADTGSGHKVISTVFIECTANYRSSGPEAMRTVGETEFVNAIARQSVGRETLAAAGIIGTADLTLGARVEEVLQAHIAAGEGRFKGIRYCAGWEDKEPQIHNSHTNPPQHLYRDHAKFREGFAVLGKLGLVFDAWLYSPQLGDLVDLARAFPQQPIVLDHVGGPLGLGWYSSRRTEVLDDWKKRVQELAACPNMQIKLGGLGMRICGFDFDKRPEAPSSQVLADAWKPYVETCIDLFGPARCMFESNFPVDKLSGSYAVYWNAFKRLAAGASPSEKAQLFRDTARKFYRLP
jgi:L-fuconolactonase